MLLMTTLKTPAWEARLPLALNSLVPIYTPGWSEERPYDSKMSCPRTQYSALARAWTWATWSGIQHPRGAYSQYTWQGGSDGASYCEPKTIHEPEILHHTKTWHKNSLPQKIQDLRYQYTQRTVMGCICFTARCNVIYLKMPKHIFLQNGQFGVYWYLKYLDTDLFNQTDFKT